MFTSIVHHSLHFVYEGGEKETAIFFDIQNCDFFTHTRTQKNPQIVTFSDLFISSHQLNYHKYRLIARITGQKT